MLSDDEIQEILFASEKACRHRKRPINSLQPLYAAKLRKIANDTISRWTLHGVPSRSWEKVKMSLLVSKYNLLEDTSSPQVTEEQKINHMDGENVLATPDVVDNDSIIGPSANFDDVSMDDGEEDEEADLDTLPELFGVNLNMIQLLQHFAVYTNQSQKSMTYLLTLLKVHEPTPSYSLLPKSGKELIKIDGRDFSKNKSGISLDLPKPVQINEGKYVHFGLENALNGDSPGVVNRDADLMQFVDLYVDVPNILPKPILKRIEAFDMQKRAKEASDRLKTKVPNAAAYNSLSENCSESFLPHFEVDVFIDEVKPYSSSDASGMIPILGRIHSISPSFQNCEGKRILSETSPFIIGFYSGKQKPADIASFLNPMIEEFIRLSPDPEQFYAEVDSEPRNLTASLRCVIADSPMKSYLKRTKGHSGYWACDRCIQKGERINKCIQLRNVNSKLRKDEDFLRYFVDDISVDDHINPTDLSPFVRLGYRMVSGFVVDPMHCMVEGTFGRRMEGFLSVAGEGKLCRFKLSEIDSRLKIYKKWKPMDFDRYLHNVNNFGQSKMHVKRQCLYYLCHPLFEGILDDTELEHLMMLQHAMFLLGTFEKHEVSHSNIILAEKVLKQYCVELVEREIPCRFVNHQVIHMPQDVAKYRCGVETLSAFQFESFLTFFRRSLKTGNLPAEQIRNRLIEKHKYQLPTTRSGEIIQNSISLVLEARQRFPKSLAPLKFVNNGGKYPKRLVFSSFEITTKSPNNVCWMVDGSFVVCADFKKCDLDKSIDIIGRKFKTLQNAFVKPFISSAFNIFVGSGLSDHYEKWQISDLKAKVYILPKKPRNNPTFENREQEWHLTPMLHTVRK